MRILIAAEESAGIQAIRLVQDSPDHEIVAVLTGGADDQKISPARGATISGVADHFGLSLWPARLVKDSAFAETVRRESVDLLLNIHSLYVIHPAVLDAVSIGSFNLHPGPLPRYAGMNAPSWAILNGETTHGVTLHWMQAGIDTGPIAYQTLFGIGANDTALNVGRSCSRKGIDLVKQLLCDSSSQIPSTEQDLTRRTYYGFEIPYGGNLPYESAERCERFIRACNYYPLPSPWGAPRINCQGNELGILEAARTSQPTEQVPRGTVELRNGKCFLATDDYWLEIKRVLNGTSSSTIPDCTLLNV